MNKSIIKLVLKITTITLVFSSILYSAFMFFNKQTVANETTIQENKFVYKKTDALDLGKTWVAISTNVWIRYKQQKEIPITIYKEVMSIWEIISDKKIADDSIISKNMQQVKDYLNVMKTDIKRLINNSSDKSVTLKAFISEAEYRYETAVISMRNLDTQRQIIQDSVNSNNQKIEDLKAKIDNDFSGFDSEKTKENIEEYLRLKEEVNYWNVYIVFINQFLNQYSYLNNYNKVLLDTLINNKEAIIKDAYIIIPDSWDWLLKDLDLIYTEEEFKSQ